MYDEPSAWAGYILAPVILVCSLAKADHGSTESRPGAGFKIAAARVSQVLRGTGYILAPVIFVSERCGAPGRD